MLKAFKQDEINAKYESASKSKYNRNLEAIKLEAVNLTRDLEQADVYITTTAHDNGGCFSVHYDDIMGDVYERIQKAIDSTRKSIENTRFPFNEKSDAELDADLMLIYALEREI